MLYETVGEELHPGVDLEIPLCCATLIQAGVRERCVEETPQQLSQVVRDSAPAGDHTRTHEHQRATDTSRECEYVTSSVKASAEAGCLQ